MSVASGTGPTEAQSPKLKDSRVLAALLSVLAAIIGVAKVVLEWALRPRC